MELLATIFSNLIIAVSGVLVLYAILYGIRILVANRNYEKIIEAIYRYHMHILSQLNLDWEDIDVLYEDMRNWYDYFHDMKSWSCKSILPPEKYILISPFIK